MFERQFCHLCGISYGWWRMSCPKWKRHAEIRDKRGEAIIENFSNLRHVSLDNDGTSE